MKIKIKIKNHSFFKCKVPSLKGKRTYYLPISEKFDTDLRVWDEFAGMALEEMLPIQNVSEIERQYFEYDEKMDKELILFLEKSLKIKIDENSFFWESFYTKEEQKKKGILHYYAVSFHEKNNE